MSNVSLSFGKIISVVAITWLLSLITTLAIISTAPSLFPVYRAANTVGSTQVLDGSITTVKLADDSVTTIKVSDGAITTSKLGDGSVATDKISNGAIVTAKFADGSVTSVKIANGTITTTNLATGAVTQVNIADGAISTTKIADGAVATIKLADGSVVTTKLADGSVTSSKIMDGTIQSVDLGDQSITASKIQNGAVGTIALADGSVTSAKITDGTITSADLANGSVITTKIADGAVTTSKLADLSVTNGKLASGAIPIDARHSECSSLSDCYHGTCGTIQDHGCGVVNSTLLIDADLSGIVLTTSQKSSMLITFSGYVEAHNGATMVFEPTLDGVFPGNCLVDDTHAGCLAIKSPSCGVLGCGINPTSNSEVISRTFLYAEIPPGSHEIDLGAKMIGDGAGYIIDATLVVAAIP